MHVAMAEFNHPFIRFCWDYSIRAAGLLWLEYRNKYEPYGESFKSAVGSFSLVHEILAPQQISHKYLSHVSVLIIRSNTGLRPNSARPYFWSDSM